MLTLLLLHFFSANTIIALYLVPIELDFFHYFSWKTSGMCLQNYKMSRKVDNRIKYDVAQWLRSTVSFSEFLIQDVKIGLPALFPAWLDVIIQVP